MNFEALIVVLALAIIFLAPSPLHEHAKKKNKPQRAMLEKMEAVPCGVKQKGLTGLGSFWAFVGVTDVNSKEDLPCGPRYFHRRPSPTYLRSWPRTTSTLSL